MDGTIMTNKYAEDHPLKLGFNLESLPLDIPDFWKQFLGPFAEKISANYDDGLEYLKTFDTYSFREYIVRSSSLEPTIQNVVEEAIRIGQFMEEYVTGTGLFCLGIIEGKFGKIGSFLIF